MIKFRQYVVEVVVAPTATDAANKSPVLICDTDNEFKRSSDAKGKSSGNWLF